MTDEKKPKLPPPLPQGKFPPKPNQGAKLPLPPLAGPKAAPKFPTAAPMMPPVRTPERQAAQSELQVEAHGASSSELEEMRKQMDAQISGLQRQLQEEREKLLLQTVRAKEEEALASKVEESLKDIQDRLRREKREQELQDSITKYESQIKDMEQRLASERQTWVETLRTQLSQREGQEKELETHFELRLKELERRWHEEKLGWAQALKNKDEEIGKLNKEFEKALSSERDALEKRILHAESERESFKRELKDMNAVREQEKENLLAKLEARDKEYLGIKAQQAMIVTQNRQEKEKIDQMRQLLEKMRAEKSGIGAQFENKEKEFFLLKTQFALYQARAKAEQEKTLKEMLLVKEQAQRERQQWEVTTRSREEELNLVKNAAREKETELKQAIDKKDMELSSLARMHEERLKAKEQETLREISQKETEFNSGIAAVNSKLQEKDGEIKGLLEKEREYKTTIFRYEHKLRDLEEKISASAAALESGRAASAHAQKQFELERAQLADAIKAKESEISSWREKEREFKLEAGRYEQKLSEMNSRIEVKNGELAREKDMYAEKERALAQVIAQKEGEIKNLNAQIGARDNEIRAWHEKERALKNRESELVARLDAAKEALLEKESKIAWLSSQIESRDRDIKSFREKEMEFKVKENALEGKAAQAQVLLDAKNQELVKERERSAENEKSAAARLAQKENEHLASLNAFKAKLAEKEEAVSQLVEKERGLKLALGQYENSLAELKNKNSEQAAAILSNGRRLEEALKELASVKSAAEQEKALLGAAHSKEIESIKGQILNLKEERERLLREKDAQIAALREEKLLAVSESDKALKAAQEKLADEKRAAEFIRQNLENEVKKHSADAAAHRQEMEKSRNELAFKLKDNALEIERRESLHKEEISRIQQKLETAERSAREAAENGKNEILRKDALLAEKEKAFASSAAQLKESIAGMKAEIASGAREIERMKIEKLNSENKAREDFLNLDQRAREEREELKEIISQREEELSQIRAARATFESQLRQELETKYRQDLSKLEDDKWQLTKVLKDEVSAVRRSMQDELAALEQQLNLERSEWNKSLLEKEKAASELARQLAETHDAATREKALREELEKRLATHGLTDTEKNDLLARIRDTENDAKARREDLAKLRTKYEELQSEFLKKVDESISLREELDKSGRTETVPSAVNMEASDTVILPPEITDAAHAFRSDSESDKIALSRVMSKFWRNLHQPVIEINTGDKNKNETK